MIEKPCAEIYVEFTKDQETLREDTISLLQDYFFIVSDKKTADILIFVDFNCFDKDKINIYLANSNCTINKDRENLYVFQPFKNGHLGEINSQAENLSKFVYNVAKIENIPIFHDGTIQVICL